MEYFIDENPIEGSNSYAYNFLKGYLNEIDPEEEWYIWASLENTDSFFYPLRFKAGTKKHNYYIKDLRKFIWNVGVGLNVNLGTYFNKEISLDNLAPESQIWFNYIKTFIEGRRLWNDYNDVFDDKAIDRMILNKMQLDEFDEMLAQGAPAYRGTFKLNRKTRDVHLQLNIEADTKDNTLSATFKDFLTFRERDYLVEGIKGYYLLKRGVWTKLEGISPEYIEKNRIELDQPMVFGFKNTKTFGKNILPN